MPQVQVGPFHLLVFVLLSLQTECGGQSWPDFASPTSPWLCVRGRSPPCPTVSCGAGLGSTASGFRGPLRWACDSRGFHGSFFFPCLCVCVWDSVLYLHPCCKTPAGTQTVCVCSSPLRSSFLQKVLLTLSWACLKHSSMATAVHQAPDAAPATPSVPRPSSLLTRVTDLTAPLPQPPSPDHWPFPLNSFRDLTYKKTNMPRELPASPYLSEKS